MVAFTTSRPSAAPNQVQPLDHLQLAHPSSVLNSSTDRAAPPFAVFERWEVQAPRSHRFDVFVQWNSRAVIGKVNGPCLPSFENREGWGSHICGSVPNDKAKGWPARHHAQQKLVHLMVNIPNGSLLYGKLA